MIKNYLLITIRSFKKNKIYTILNLAGLTLGLICFVLISLYVQFEMSFDTYNEKADRIYSIYKQSTGGGWLGSNKYLVTHAPMAPALKAEFPVIEAATRFNGSNTKLIRTEDNLFIEGDWLWADPYIFDIFSIDLISGDPKTALSQPNSMMISEEMAQKFFDGEDPIGKILNVDDEQDYTINGVYRSPPANSHFQASFMATFEMQREDPEELESWNNSSWHTYVLLPEGTNVVDFEDQLERFIHTKTYDEDSETPVEKRTQYFLLPVTEIRHRADINFHIGPTSDMRYIYIFSAIALFIILIASVNYMNLATARSLIRAKEVGVRKVAGAQRNNLIIQFLGESLMITMLALVAAISCASFLLPYFNEFAEVKIPTIFSYDMSRLFLFVGTGIAVGILAGLYPALFISRYKIVSVIKGSFSKSSKGMSMRNMLVVFQFSISIFLIVSTLVVMKQIDFIRTTDIGVERDMIVSSYVRDPGVREAYEEIKAELLQDPRISHVTKSTNLPFQITSNSGYRFEPESDKRTTAYTVHVDYDYFDLFGLEFIEGRGFSPDFPSDTSNAIVINETVAKRMGWEKSVGRTFKMWGDKEAHIIGVVKDFHYSSMHLPIEPVVIRFRSNWSSRVSIKIAPGDIPGALEKFEEVSLKHSTGYPFDYSFADETYDRMYKTDLRFGKIFTIFSILAIAISCLGLLGLASFAAEHATKEIGIRRILGASITSVVRQTSWKLLKWVLAANLVALPVGYFVMEMWLENFTYKVEQSPDLFIYGSFGALVIAVITISFQTLKAANKKPVEALRYE